MEAAFKKRPYRRQACDASQATGMSCVTADRHEMYYSRQACDGQAQAWHAQAYTFSQACDGMIKCAGIHLQPSHAQAYTYRQAYAYRTRSAEL